MTSIPINLLKDLAGLVKRHPARDWVSLARLLEDDDTRIQLVSLFKEAAALTGPHIGKTRKATPAKSRTVPSSVDNWERFELELSRSPIARLRYLARGYGIPVSAKDSRRRLRDRILASARRGEIKIGGHPGISPGESQGDYAKWADIIIRGR